MAKFRMNHGRKGKGSSGMIVRVGLFSAIIGGLFFIFNQFMGEERLPEEGTPAEIGDYYLPTSISNTIIKHRYYTLSYSEEAEQAEWVAYQLKGDDLRKPWLDRVDNFRPDPRVPSGSATPNDYKYSGYDRGHLVPVADRAFSEQAMDETFFMSNISPQARNFNKGVWRELEELARSWAKQNGELFVVTGPVLSLPPKGTIGDNKVAIPAAYYKVLLDLQDPQLKGIGFIIPNEVTFEPLYKFTVSIDSVEELTGINFFGELLPRSLEEEIEGEYNADLWEFSKQKHQERIEKWNNQ